MAAWSFALDPYYNENLTKYFDDPVLDKMADIIVWGYNIGYYIVHISSKWAIQNSPFYGKTCRIGVFTERIDSSIPIQDPYTYRDRLNKIPKLVIMASGDEFFTPDDSWAWFDEMKVRVHRVRVQGANGC